MKKLFSFSYLIILAITIGQAQDTDSLMFENGRILTSLYGNISNQYVDVKSGGSIKTTGYRIGTQSGVFIKNNWALGVNFGLSKLDFNRPKLEFENEELLLGLWTRLYFAQSGGASLYAELSPHYSSWYYRNSAQNNENDLIYDEKIFGKGFGVIPGIGFLYIISKNVGFGMSLSYAVSKLYLDKTNFLLESKTPDISVAAELQFNFSFQIYLDQFFF